MEGIFWNNHLSWSVNMAAAAETDTKSGAQRNGPETADPELAEIRKDLAALAHSVGLYSRHRSGDAVEEIRHLIDALQQSALVAEKKIEKTMRDHPREWIGSAVGLLGIGLALGLIFGRRS
jgi:ElaB/YqjD/DUF883 family membrane-anchored ribosome-binding protein